MDIDAARRAGLCFHCAQPGHVMRFCPARRVNIRAATAELSVEEIREMLRQAEERDGGKVEEGRKDFVEGRE